MITIIVLLILAMVSISLVMNSGIITKSKDSVDKYSAEEITEQLKLAYSEYQMAVYSDGVSDATEFVKVRLQGIFGDKLDANSVSVADGKVIAKINETTYEYNAVTGKSGEKKPGIGELVKEENYGNYIDLGKNIIGTNSTADDWRILYNDKAEGKVYAILADLLPNNSGIATSAGLGTYGEYGVFSLIANRDDFLSKFDSEKWKKLLPDTLQENSNITVKGAVKAEKIIASYNGKNNRELSLRERILFYIDSNNTSKGMDELYIPNNESQIGYWLSTIPNSGTGYEVYWVKNSEGKLKDQSGYINDVYGSDGVGVRPVVVLDSDLQVTSTTSNGVTVWSLVNN